VNYFAAAMLWLVQIRPSLCCQIANEKRGRNPNYGRIRKPMRISLHFLKILTIAALICFCATCLGAQESASVPEKVRKYRLAHENEIVGEFARLLSIPNLASDMPNIERNARAITKALESRGVSVQLLREPGAPPIVYGHLNVAGVRPTIGIYAHYDGQPVDSPQWQSPPFGPVLRDTAGQTVDWKTQNHYDPESRIYARSAGDDKAAIAATISASDFPVFRTAMDNPTAQAVVKAIERAKGSPIVQAVSMGGTVPMYLLTGSRHTPVLGVPIANHDDNQHAADENLRLQNLWDAIEVYATILATVGNDKSAWPSSNY
jgi:acetylornithine deacetylase/succinyl-diaminopimelate desuccinylase-like protein